MNLVQLHQKLIGAARNNPPGDQVPYGFEKRIMAGLKIAPCLDEWAMWARAFWCGAGVCAAITLSFCVWSSIPAVDSDSVASFSHDLEQTILASADDGDAA